MRYTELPRHFLQENRSMKTTVKWTDGAMFVGESGSGHSVVMDGPEDLGGRNLGPRPMEMLLLGTGGCSVYDVMSMLKKSRQQVVDCRVELDAERADAVPAVFTRINMHFVVTGVGLKQSQVKRAVELSAEKYCSASIMFGAAGVEINHSFEIVEFEL
jgi:putative redox protein